MADAQADRFPANPCALVNCYKCNGYYCGLSPQNGFGGGDPQTLYLCVDGSTVDAEHCGTDCVMSASKLADVCDHCTGLSNGRYCGSALGYPPGYNGAFTALDNVIFGCDGGRYSGSQQECDAGTTCVQNGTVASCQ